MKYKFENRILWTNDEKKRLAFAVYYYLKLHPDKSPLQAINVIQKSVLVPNRIRKIISYASVESWLDPELKSLKSSDVKINVELELAKVPFEQIVTELINRFDNKLQSDMKVILNQIEKNIENKIMEKLNSLEELVLNNKILESSNSITTPPTKYQKIKKKKMIIVGLLHSQFNEIKLEYSEYFDMKNWSNDGSVPKLKSMLTYADHVFTMVNFIAHSTDGLIVQSGANYTRVAGGIVTLKEELDKHI